MGKTTKNGHMNLAGQTWCERDSRGERRIDRGARAAAACGAGGASHSHAGPTKINSPFNLTEIKGLF